MVKADDGLSLVSNDDSGVVRKFRRRERRIVKAQLSLALVFGAVAIAAAVIVNAYHDGYYVRLGYMDEVHFAAGVTSFLALMGGLLVLKRPSTGARVVFFGFALASVICVGLSCSGVVSDVPDSVWWLRSKIQTERCLYQMKARCAQTTTPPPTTTTTDRYGRGQRLQRLRDYEEEEGYSGDRQCSVRHQCNLNWIKETERELSGLEDGWAGRAWAFAGLLAAAAALMIAHALAGLCYVCFSLKHWYDRAKGPFWGLTKDHPHVLYISCCCEPKEGAEVVPFVIAIGPRGKAAKKAEEETSAPLTDA